MIRLRKHGAVAGAAAIPSGWLSPAMGQQPVMVGVPPELMTPGAPNPAERMSAPVATRFTSKIGFFYAKFLLPEKLPDYPFPWGGPKP